MDRLNRIDILKCGRCVWDAILLYNNVVGYSFLIMIRAIVLMLLAIISVRGQDSTLVREYCNKLGQLSETSNIESFVPGIDEMTVKYLERNPIIGDNPIQEVIRFQYRLMRELKRGCPSYVSDRIRLIPKSVIDLESKLTKQQIDSLGMLTAQIERDKKVHLYVVTIDDFFPDTTITDFANRYREFWAPSTSLEKGVVLIVFSNAQRKVRISTGDISMTYLTDEECSEVNKVMIPYFRSNKYFYGLVEGLIAIKSRL